MPVDHGLGGKESEKSRTRRERKAKRLRTLNRSLQNKDLGNTKKDVVFDEDSRVAFLTGFHKRKQERRKYGLTMQILKEKKQRKEIIKTRNLSLLEQKESNKRGKDIPMPASDDEDEDGEDDGQGSLADEASVFEDDATVSMFGSAVSVVVSDNIGGEDDEDPRSAGGQNDDSDDEDEDGDDSGSVVSRLSAGSQQSWMKKKSNKKEMSKFERAMKKVTQTIGLRKKKSHVAKSKFLPGAPRDMRKKVESKKLLTKFLGTKGMSAKKRKN